MNKDVLNYEIQFNTAVSKTMHIDLNSCFASIEQQANPFLRNKPIAVAAYNSPNGCILAPSVDAKKYGIKTGMRIKDARLLFNKLIVLEPDPPKYRFVHKKLSNLISSYTQKFEAKSIDEFVLDFDHHESFKKGIFNIGEEIKQRIKSEIGDYLTVSIGIAPNRFLAKTASNLHKPDGLDEINYKNYLEIYKKLALIDLCGINTRNAARLNSVGIFSVLDFYLAYHKKLCLAFESKVGYYWYLRLRGFEVDNIEWDTKSIGHSYSLPKPIRTIEEIGPIMQKLIEKIARRIRKGSFIAHGVSVAIHYKDSTFWHKSETYKDSLFEASDIFKKALNILYKSPTYRSPKPIRTFYITTFALDNNNTMQLELFNDLNKKQKLTNALDKIAEKYGEFTVTAMNMLPAKTYVPDRIAFGKVKEVF